MGSSRSIAPSCTASSPPSWPRPRARPGRRTSRTTTRRGGDPEHAARCWLEAGRVAAGTGASTEAITLFRRSLSALDDLPEGAERTTLELDVQLGLGTAASALEGYTSPNARAAFERAVALGERLGDTATIFPALWGTSSYWFVLGEHRLDHGLVERLRTHRRGAAGPALPLRGGLRGRLPQPAPRRPRAGEGRARARDPAPRPRADRQSPRGLGHRLALDALDRPLAARRARAQRRGGERGAAPGRRARPDRAAGAR